MLYDLILAYQLTENCLDKRKKENNGQECYVSVQVPEVLFWASALFPL